MQVIDRKIGFYVFVNLRSVGAGSAHSLTRRPPTASRFREYLEIPTMRLSTLVHHTMPFVALGSGILVLIRPQLLNFVVAVYLILTGIVGLNGLYHFVR
jgi:hypothetical protein